MRVGNEAVYTLLDFFDAQYGRLGNFYTPTWINDLNINTGFGSAIGTGKQYIPWIHIDDLCGIYIKAIEDTKMIGAYNAVAPEHLTNKEFTQALATILKRTLWFPNIPAVVMKTLFGKMAEILLQGSRVSSEKIQTTGYKG